MKPGDLVKMKPMKGFSWWEGRVFVVLDVETGYRGWVNLLTDDGGKIQVEKTILEVLL